MKNLITIFSLLAIIVVGNSQTKEAYIDFEKKQHDFGQIQEEKGNVTTSFNFTNTGSKPLIIKRVHASCGCTTPDYTKQPIPPGGKGFVKATFNPVNRPNKFNKSITVYTNAENGTETLRIMGDVLPKPQTVEDKFPRAFGDVRMKTNHVAFFKITSDQIETRDVEVINTGTSSVDISFKNAPSHVKITAEPETLRPGAEGRIVVEYDATKVDDWGFVMSRADMLLNGQADANQNIVISATISEDFSNLSSSELENAPRAVVNDREFNFGKIPEGDKISHEFVVKNEGVKDLMIRKVKSSCGCTVTNPDKKIVPAGETAKITATFDSRGRKGNQFKQITVITNDPNSQNIMLYVKGEVVAN